MQWNKSGAIVGDMPNGFSLVPYGFDRDTADQSTKFCTLIPLDV